MKFRYGWLPIFVTLISQIYKTMADCTWLGECDMYCNYDTLQQLNNSIGVKMNASGIEECRSNGIKLSLRQLTYPGDIIASNWFQVDVKVIELDVRLTNKNRVIEADAFVSDAFRTVKRLIITTFNIEIIRNGIFNGLDELEIIEIIGAENIKTIENGLLDSINELKKFTFDQSLSNNPAISINGFTGYGQLPKLEDVKFTYTLTDTITESTFIGLANVKTLDLSSCQIQSIGPNSFDPIINSIESLNLKRNLLTTIPSGLFDAMLPKNGLIIDLSEHSWNCSNCELMSFRTFIDQFEGNLVGPIRCSTSGGCIDSNILESECFNHCPTPEPPPTSPPILPTTSPPSPIYITRGCYNEHQFSVNVSIKPPSTYMTIKENESGEVNLTISGEESCSSVVIWYSENQVFDNIISPKDVNCVSRDDRNSITITNLMANIVYLFCLMDKTSSQVSPFDCISYIKREEQNGSVWLLKSSKTLTITLLVVGLASVVVFGVGITFWILNYNPFTLRETGKKQIMLTQSQTPANINENINQTSNIFNKKVSNTTTYSDNGMLTSNVLQYDTPAFYIPPLPARPPNIGILEEPVYSSVDEIYEEK